MSISSAIESANASVAIKIAHHMRKEYLVTPREWRIVRDEVLSALRRGTDNGKAIDVLRVAHNAIGIPYHSK